MLTGDVLRFLMLYFVLDLGFSQGRSQCLLMSVLLGRSQCLLMAVLSPACHVERNTSRQYLQYVS